MKKFRVWHNQLNKFLPKDEWILDLDGKLIFVELSDCCGKVILQAVNPALYTIQQFTGLKDKNGREIYEGDIINFTLIGFTHGPEPEDIKHAEVWYNDNDCMFCFGKYDTGSMDYHFSMADRIKTKSIEIVGNIFENKDLIKLI